MKLQEYLDLNHERWVDRFSLVKLYREWRNIENGN